jgi:UDP-N-acetylmuramate--alanine ligase
VDGDAEGPTAIAEAIRLSRQVYGARRLWSVVSAEAAGRGARMAAALAVSDRVLVAGSGPDGEGPALVRRLAANGVRARWAAGLDEAADDLDRLLRPGDVLLTLGPGDVGKVADALSARRAARDHRGR